MIEPPGILAVWNDFDPIIEEDEYHEWYLQDHLVDRLRIPGFLVAGRYEVVGPGLKYFTWYRTDSAAVMNSPAYIRRLKNPTEWTQRCMGAFKNMSRSACRETLDIGRGIGGAVVTMGIKAAAGRGDDLRQHLSSSLFPDLVRSPGKGGIIRAHLWEADLGVTVQKNPEESIRGEKDRVADRVVVLETSSSAIAEKAAKEMASYPFTAWGAESIAAPSVYRLMHYFPNPEGR